jgi:hypothetical protein
MEGEGTLSGTSIGSLVTIPIYHILASASTSRPEMLQSICCISPETWFITDISLKDERLNILPSCPNTIANNFE